MQLRLPRCSAGLQRGWRIRAAAVLLDHGPGCLLQGDARVRTGMWHAAGAALHSTATQGALQQPLLLLLLRSAGALSAAASIVCLCDLALWVLRTFLPASPWIRHGVLLYWGLLMAVALPAMLRALRPSQTAPRKPGYVIAQAAPAAQPTPPAGCAMVFPLAPLPPAPPIPHIILRKGYHVLALALFVPVMAVDPDMLQVRRCAGIACMHALERMAETWHACTQMHP